MSRPSTAALLAARFGVALVACSAASSSHAAQLDRTATRTGPLFLDDEFNRDPRQVPTAADDLFFLVSTRSNPIIVGPSSVGDGRISQRFGWVFTGAAGGTLITGTTYVREGRATALNNAVVLSVTDELSWDNAGDIRVGWNGFGSLLVDGGSDLSADQVIVGEAAGSEALTSLSGAGTTLTGTRTVNDGIVQVERSGGAGTLRVLAGAQLRTAANGGNDILVGSGTGSTGTLEVDGVGSFAETEDPVVGFGGGSGTLIVAVDGRIVNADGGPNGSPDTLIGRDTGSTGTAFVSGSGVLQSRAILVGSRDGAGSLDVSTGGVVRTVTQGSAAGEMMIGRENGGLGIVAVHGLNSLLEVDDRLHVGDDDEGILRVGQELGGEAAGSGRLRVGTDPIVANLAADTGVNFVAIDGSNTFANVGDRTRVGLGGRGAMEVTGGAAFTTRFLDVGGNTGSTGTVTVNSGGRVTASDDSFIGPNAGSTGTLLVTGGGSVFDNDDNAPATASDDNLTVGGSGSGTADVPDGGHLLTEGVAIGAGTGAGAASLRVSGAGSTLSGGGFLTVGDTRRGEMVVEDGARVSVASKIAAERLIIGNGTEADGSGLSVDGAGSRVDHDGTAGVSVGNAGAAPPSGRRWR